MVFKARLTDGLFHSFVSHFLDCAAAGEVACARVDLVGAIRAR